MPYLPKSKYSIKNTAGGELVLKPEEDENSKKQSFAKDVLKHKIFNKGIAKFLNNTEPIPTSKPQPTDKDYKNGVFTRYFAKKINEDIFIELNEKVYKEIKKKSPKYDYNLYQIGIIRWHLTGNVYKKNSISIRNTQKKYKTINNYFIKLDEYKLNEPMYQSHLYTEGGELYLANGKEYIGEYHIHTTGPMVGAVHKDQPHAKLYYVNKLPSPPDTTYEDFLSSITPTEGQTYTPTTSTSNIQRPTTTDKYGNKVSSKHKTSTSTKGGSSSGGGDSSRGRSGY